MAAGGLMTNCMPGCESRLAGGGSGYRRLEILLCHEGVRLTHKRRRRYAEERLQLCRLWARGHRWRSAGIEPALVDGFR